MIFETGSILNYMPAIEDEPRNFEPRLMAVMTSRVRRQLPSFLTTSQYFGELSLKSATLGLLRNDSATKQPLRLTGLRSVELWVRVRVPLKIHYRGADASEICQSPHVDVVGKKWWSVNFAA
ncbi:hypothetical protein TNCV_3129271 [Trichonephila clavipes]|nr:hypothetical protein TNCV_3129271 [Trichonephila clavipes]